ncbi:MAG: P-loop NTPase [Deltaproteobacteria bacterium]|nr:P-loop NTPase [Deltaproteobacteria bacterium]
MPPLLTHKPGEGEPTAVPVMLVGLGEEAVQDLVNGLGALVRVVPAPVAVPYADAEPMAWVERPRVVFVDFDRAPEKAMEIGPKLLDMLPGLLLVALSDHSDADRIRAAMRAGYREYLVIPADFEVARRSVEGVAKALAGVEDTKGRILVVTGAKGGVGTTFLTTSLAAAMAATQRVLAVDLVYGAGDVGILMDLRPTGGIAELLRNTGRLDDRVVEACAVAHASQAWLLPQPEDAHTYEPPDETTVLRVLHAAARAFPVVLVDVGSTADEQSLTAVATADLVLLVTTPEVPALRNVWRRMRLFDRLGVERDRIRLVINRWSRTAPVTRKDIEANLNLTVYAMLSDDPRSLYAAINYGKLVRDVSRRSQLAREIGALAERLGSEALAGPAPRRAAFPA